MATEAAKPANNSEDLFQDKTTRAARDKALDHMKWGPLIGSVARFMMAIGGPILGAGLFAMLGAGTPAMAASAPLIALAGAALTAVGISIEYAGTRAAQAAGLDQAELSAQCNARHLVQEMKSSHISMSFEQNQRADGRSWVQATGRDSQGLQQQV